MPKATKKAAKKKAVKKSQRAKAAKKTLQKVTTVKGSNAVALDGPLNPTPDAA